MPKQIADRSVVPRGNYDFTVKETGQTFSSHVFHPLVTKVVQHMASNGVPVPKNISDLMEEDFCERKPEYCRDTEHVRINGEDGLTQVVAALAIPAAEALHKIGAVLGINCTACNQRRRIIKRIRELGVSETLRQLKGTLKHG